ncbi:MAG TPA: hypothetical protein VFB58_03450 [Chloroflexota bacterium]|nr:hypothetical protein [Chloroflexota bacterium]
MEQQLIRHRPRRLDCTHLRVFEYETDILAGPRDEPHVVARCPDCDCVMMYRGIARLRNGTLVHYFECVHSPREVHCVSITIRD